MENSPDRTAVKILAEDVRVVRYNLQNEVVSSYHYARTIFKYSIDHAIEYALVEWDVY